MGEPIDFNGEGSLVAEEVEIVGTMFVLFAKSEAIRAQLKNIP